MVLSIKSGRADQMARELAKLNGAAEALDKALIPIGRRPKLSSRPSHFGSPTRPAFRAGEHACC